MRTFWGGKRWGSKEGDENKTEGSIIGSSTNITGWPLSRAEQSRFMYKTAAFLSCCRIRSAHAAQDHTGQTHHQWFDCRNESRTNYVENEWVLFVTCRKKYTCADARLSVSDALLPSSGAKWNVRSYFSRSLCHPGFPVSRDAAEITRAHSFPSCITAIILHAEFRTPQLI